MAQEYRYPLTRVCLRGGAMTLPRTMIGLFPGEGSVVAVDTLTGTEHTLYMNHPRVVAGLGPMFREHGLEVNDELLIVQSGDGSYSITPVLRSATPVPAEDAEGEPRDEEHVQPFAASSDAQVHAGAATSSEAGVSADAEGSSDADVAADAELPSGAQASAAAGTSYDAELSAAAEARAAAAAAAGLDARGDAYLNRADTDAQVDPADLRADHQGVTNGILDPRLAVQEAESALAELDSERAHAADNTEPSQGTLWGNEAAEGRELFQAARDLEAAEVGAASPVREIEAATDREEGEAAAATQVEEGQPEPRSRTAGRGAAFEDEDDNDAALAAIALTSRVRRVLSPLGFRIEPLAAGVAYLHAEMGRRRYKVLVQTLRSGERLDWAGLLSRRRNAPANYLAVMGDRADLVRLTNPANLARATLWSWEALGRLEELHASVPVTPLDLESHFDRDGLFEQGLKRFETGVSARIAERGAASEVLTRLARLKAPAVFLLEELAQDVSLSRDAVLRILDRFAEAPMHLVAKVGSGEFLLRQPVDVALASLAAYADSLRQRLPTTRREVITGLDDDYGAAAESQLLDDTTEATGSAE